MAEHDSNILRIRTPRIPALVEDSGRIRFIISLIALVISVTILGLILNQRIGFYIVPTTSMEPTLHPNDRIVAVSSAAYERGQVVVVRDPEKPSGYLVKRIVGMPGDRVEVFSNRLMVNGRTVSEPYLSEPIEYQLPPTQVPGGEVFLLGDNRNESEDSHLWRRGVPVSDIVGVVRYIYSPGERRGARIAYTDVFAGVAQAKAPAEAAMLPGTTER